MAFQKFRADQLFDGYRFLDNQFVLILKEDGTVVDIVKYNDAGDDVQIFTGIISPGFINCHCHLELSHMRGLIPERTGLVKFVSQVMKDRHLPEEAILQAISDAETQMLSANARSVRPGRSGSRSRSTRRTRYPEATASSA